MKRIRHVNLQITYEEKCVKNKKNVKKGIKSDEKIENQLGKTALLKNKMKTHDEKLTKVQIDKIEEDANQNGYKIVPNIPVSNRFRILDKEENCFQDDSSFPRNVSSELEDSKLSSIPTQQFSHRTILSETSLDVTSNIEVNSDTLCNVLNMFSHKLDDSLNELKHTNAELGGQAKKLDDSLNVM